MRLLTKKLNDPTLTRGRVKLLEQITSRASHASGFDFPAVQVGMTNWTGADGKPTTVYYDPATGAQGLAVAQNILPRLDALFAWCDDVFGMRGDGGNVIICAVGSASDGTGGAYHYGCGFGTQGGDWYVDVADGNPDLTFGLCMAEISESYMGLSNRGWKCGGSGGEALSRFLAEIVSGGPNGALVGFTSGPSWDGSDWIDQDKGTDQDYPSIGCGVLYLWWMVQQFTPAQIVQAGEPDGNLASNYATLTGQPAGNAFPALVAAVAAVGGPGSFQGDNPFNSSVPPFPPVSPPSPPPPGPVPSPPPSPPPVPPPSPAPAPTSGPTLAQAQAALLQATQPAIYAALQGLFPPTVAPAGIAAQPPKRFSWSAILAEIEILVRTYGPEARPIIDAFIERLNLPPFVKAILESIVNDLLGQPAG